jgi:DNA-binding MarR family transcriptional regulator
MYQCDKDMNITDFAIYNAIRALEEEDVITQKDIANFIPCHRVVVTRSIKRLEEAGYIERTGCKTNRKYKTVRGWHGFNR